ncbi:MAG: hypothetical protein HWE27_03760 [Gammaproteobacteria bacterium]|nr:hypothetical protein [Gammaproteobacteria bacterium]
MKKIIFLFSLLITFTIMACGHTGRMNNSIASVDCEILKSTSAMPNTPLLEKPVALQSMLIQKSFDSQIDLLEKKFLVKQLDFKKESSYYINPEKINSLYTCFRSVFKNVEQSEEQYLSETIEVPFPYSIESTLANQSRWLVESVSGWRSKYDEKSDLTNINIVLRPLQCESKCEKFNLYVNNESEIQLSPIEQLEKPPFDKVMFDKSASLIHIIKLNQAYVSTRDYKAYE